MVSGRRAFAFILAVALATTAARADSLQSDPDHRFTVSVPLGWMATSTSTVTRITRNGTFVNIVKVTGQEGPQAVLRYAVQQASRYFHGGRQLDQGRATLGGEQAIYADYGTYDRNNIPTYVRLVVTGTGWVFYSGTPARGFAQRRDTLRRIEHSFKLTPSGEAHMANASPLGAMPPARSGAAVSPQKQHVDTTLTLHPAEIVDSSGRIGGVAYRLLVPAGWHVRSGIVWSSSVIDPATPQMRVVSPDGNREIGWLPDLPFIAFPQSVQGLFAPGIQYAGTTVMPLDTDPVDVVQRFAIPRYFPTLRSAQVIGKENLPKLARATLERDLGGAPNAQTRAVRIRFEYDQDGHAIDEDVYAVLVDVTMQAQQGIGHFWGLTGIRYSRAPKGMLDKQFALFDTMVSSTKINRHWSQALGQLTQQMARQQIEASREASIRSQQQEITSQNNFQRFMDTQGVNNSDVSDRIMHSFHEQMAVGDKVANDYSQYMRGVQSYNDPSTGGTVELPYGYTNAWRNGDGDYVLTQDPSYDPNVGALHSWRSLGGPAN